ncbi:MAG TPA: hypothetical protein VK031_02880 [Tissierellaceae bacterium]|nr:hypothetical protein [Tissierellaceae bacterium]
MTEELIDELAKYIVDNQYGLYMLDHVSGTYQLSYEELRLKIKEFYNINK